VSLLDEWTLFEERSNIRFPTAYGLPSLSEDLVTKASGGGVVGEEGKPGAKWETNRNGVVLPPHPSGFEEMSLGWTLKMRPERTRDGKVRVACVVEQDGLRGFVNWGVPITVMQPAGILKKEKPRIATENRQLFPVFLAQRRELMFEPEGDKLVAKVVSDMDESAPGGEEFVEGFADRLRSPELPKLRIEVEATPVEVVAERGVEKKDDYQIFVMTRFVESPAFDGGPPSNVPFLADPQFQIMIRHLNQLRDVDLLSGPSLVFKNGESKEMELIREFIYPASYDPPTLYPATAKGFPASPATPKDWEKTTVGLKLQVKASLRPKGMIELELSPMNEELRKYLDFGAPIHHVENGKLTSILVSENRIETPVFAISAQRMKAQMPDGHTVCVGGFVRKWELQVEDKLPVLGLVTDSKRVVERKHVCIFVTARVVDTNGMPVK